MHTMSTTPITETATPTHIRLHEEEGEINLKPLAQGPGGREITSIRLKPTSMIVNRGAQVTLDNIRYVAPSPP